MQRNIISAAGTSRWIGIAAPSSLLNPELLEKGAERLASWGYAVRTDDSLLAKHRYLAGTDAARAQALMRIIKDPSVGTIWCARGGYGATRLLALLDKMGAPEALRKTPKLLLGFSDATALHFYVQRLGLASVHSPMPATASWQKLKPATERLLKLTLKGQLPIGAGSHTALWRTNAIETGASEGLLTGGNLTLLANLIGTPWQPNLRGKILFLEDCGERPYRVDRMLTQLENAGLLKGLAGVLLGDFEADVEYKERAERKYMKEVFAERFSGRGYPVLTGLPVGHGKENEPLPLGVRARISKDGKLWLLEQPVQKR